MRRQSSDAPVAGRAQPHRTPRRDRRAASTGRLARERVAELPIADFDGPTVSRIIGMEANTLTQSGLPESGWAHRHTFYQIAYIASGRGSHGIDCRSYPMRPSTLYFLRPDQVHVWNYHSMPTGYSLAFSAEFLLSAPHHDAVARNVEMFNDLVAAAHVRLTPAQSRAILPVIRSIVHESHTAREDHRSVMQAYLHILLVSVHRLLPPPEVEVAHTPRSAILARRFTELVAEHLTHCRLVRAYSDQLGVTPSHLAETVKAVTGHTPSQLIRRAQTVEARRLLVHTDKNVAEIAYELGFKDTAYFARFFKRESGVTPGEFRRGARSPEHAGQARRERRTGHQPTVSP